MTAEALAPPGARTALTAWLVASVLGVVLVLWWLPASIVDGDIVPFGNDAFYHARRVLDAVAAGGLVREFDPAMHAPEGSLVVWPWAYDSALALIARAVLAVVPGADAFAVVAWVPPLALPLSAWLVIMIARRVGAGGFGMALAGIAFVLAPPLTAAHLVGAIDHHYAECAFALAALALSLAWVAAPGDARRAALLGVVLGLAHGVHNGLFVLQLPLLAALALAWLTREGPGLRAASAFALALPLTTLLVALPSTALQQGAFEYFLLSWFHVAAAAASALLVLVMGRWPARGMGLALAAGVVLATLLALSRHVAGGVGWAAADLAYLGDIVEARSLAEMAVAEGFGMLRVQGALPLLLPLLPIAIALRWRGHRPQALVLLAFGLFGCAMYALQSRFWYQAIGPLLAALAIVVSALPRLAPRSRKLGAALLVLLAVAPSLPARTQVLAPANSPGYPELRPLLARLAAACAERPGIVLARADFGHLISYHTRCPVIANNFILTPQQIGKIAEAERLLALAPEALLAASPQVEYLLMTPPLRPAVDATSWRASALEQALMLDGRDPPGYESLGRVATRRTDGTAVLAAEAWRLTRGVDAGATP